MHLSPVEIRSFQEMIFDWWRRNRRDLPWRRTRNPYRILVSEIMLQQTQVSRVIPAYKQFIDEFPDAASLAAATPAMVLRSWKGMGYNRRALYLQRAAKIITENYHGKFPADVSLLRSLPGIGKYTAAAIAVFAFKKQIAAVDTNIRQIITHFFFQDKEQSDSSISSAAHRLLPAGRAWEWHQALMDYGALALVIQRPKRRKSDASVVPFRQSNRFFRGRIIDRLRDGSADKITYLNELEQTYKRPRKFFLDIITSLIREGMIKEESGDRWELPI